MSRSFKKTPGFSDGDNSKKFQKRAAAKKVRSSSEVPNGKQYRKLYNPWKICDHNCRVHSQSELENITADGYLDPPYKWRMK